MSNTTSANSFAFLGAIATNSLGALAAIWGLALAVLLIGLPIALLVALALRLGRMVFGGL